MKITEVTGKIKLPAMASAWYLASGAVGKLAGVLATPLFTRLLDSNEYGKFTLYMSLLGAAAVVCSAVSSGSAVYKGLRDFKCNEREYLKAVLLTTLCFSIVICILLFAFSPIIDLNPLLLIPLSIQILCDGVVAIFLAKARFYYKYKLVAFVSICGAALPPILSIAALSFVGGDYKIRIFSFLFVSIALAVYALIYLNRQSKKTDRHTVWYVIKRSMPLLPHTISSALSTHADKFIISAVLGADGLAKYSVVFSLGIALQFIVNSIGSALSPWIIRRLEAREEKRIAELVLPMTLGYFALSVCLIALSPEALKILAPSDYFDAFPALIPIALSVPFYFISSVVTVGLIHSSKGRYSAMISCLGAALSVTLNYTLINQYGYLGAGLAFLIQQAVCSFIGILLLSEATKKRFISFSSVLLPCLASICVGGLLYLLKNLLWARCLVLLIPAAALVYCLSIAKTLVIEKTKKSRS